MTGITAAHDIGGFAKDTPISPLNPGKSRYCYLFPTLAEKGRPGIFADSSGDEETIRRLLDIAKWMEGEVNLTPINDPSMRISVPAAHTYFAQFVNHDMSAPVGGMLQDVNTIADAATINDQHLPAGKLWRGSVLDILDHFQNEHEHPLTLSSLYGDGPFGTADRVSPPETRAMYDADGPKFRLGQVCDDHLRFPSLTTRPDAVVRQKLAKDIPRENNPAKPPKALIADRRNDENLILSQMHLAFMLFHNKAVDALGGQAGDPRRIFSEARRLVTHHYQWCILHDLLPMLLAESVLRDLDYYAPSKLEERSVPLEFSTAAYRFGHSMIADSYDYNPNFGTEGIIAKRAHLGDLFAFTSKGGMGELGPHSPLPDHWVVDWDRLTDPTRKGESRADRIDVNFAHSMLIVAQQSADGLGSIIARNLARSFHRRIPFGQVLAQQYGLDPLKGPAIAKLMPRGLEENPAFPDSGDKGIKRKAMLNETPAWLYFLCEARHDGGSRLGPAASHIVADTFKGLMQQDPESILGARGRGWTPAQSPLKTAARQPIATLRDLLLFAVA